MKPSKSTTGKTTAEKKRFAKIKKLTTLVPPVPPPHNPLEVGIVAGAMGFDGMPDLEYGPSAWLHSNARFGYFNLNIVLGMAALQLAKKPDFREYMNARFRAVFVISDTEISREEINGAVCGIARATGTYTEARRRVEAVKWIVLPHDLKCAGIAGLASAELELAQNETPDLEIHEVMFIVLRKYPLSFDGTPVLDIAQAICGEAFTAKEVNEAEKQRATYKDSAGYKDDEPDNWKK